MSLQASSPTVEEVVRSVQYGDINFLQTALESYGISPNLKDREDCSLLHWAAVNNRIAIIELLLQHNADVNVVGGDAREIPIQWAVRHARCTKVVSMLLEHGSDIHHKSVFGYDALQLATQAGNLHIVFLLLEAGANPNTVDRWNDTPLYSLLKSDIKSSTLDIIRLLIRYHTDVNHSGNDGNNALHIMANNSSFDSYCAFLICTSGTKQLYESRNKDGKTPFDVAVKKRNAKMLRFLFDIFMYRNFPRFLPIFIAALSFVLFFVCVHACGWLYGVCVYLAIYLVLDTLCQTSLISESSRLSCGFAWGIIVSSTCSYYYFLSNYYGFVWDCIIGALAFTICYTLLSTMYTKPVHLLSQGEESRKSLVRKIVGAEPIVNSEGIAIGNSFKFCATCLTDKSMVSTHCSKCNICVPSLDHHCPFVNNCVGKGNRRIFVLFTLSASVGCAIMSLLSFLTHHQHFCPDIAGSQIWALFSVQICMLKNFPALALSTWVAFNSAIWIFAIFWGQMAMVASETTTFEILKRGNHGTACLSQNGLRNMIAFLSTGQYQTASCAGHRCCDKDVESQFLMN